MITKKQWIKAIKDTRKLWEGVHVADEYLLNSKGEELGKHENCPFCVLVDEQCDACIAGVDEDYLYYCTPHINRIEDSPDPQKTLTRILDKLERKL